MNLCDKNLLSYIKQGASKKGSITGRPEIDRPKLREVLYNSLLPNSVKWSHKLVEVTSESDTDDLILKFANGNTEKGFDLIVGADGAWSRVRPLLSTAKPYFSGIAGHAFRIPNAESTHPDLYTLVNRGSVFSWSDGKSIMAQYMGDGSINIGTWSRHSEDWKDEYDVQNPKAVKEQCRKEYADWDERLVKFTQVAEDATIAPRDLFMLPIGHKWEHRKGVTLVGDAAHVMTPFAGEGVNLALQDVLKLSQAIIQAAGVAESEREQVLDEQIRLFEQDMFMRATETQQLTYDMMHAMFFVPGSPRNGIEDYITRAVEGEVGYWPTRLFLRPVVYAYFFVFKMIW